MQSGWALGMVSEKITQSIGLVVRSPRQPASEQLRLAYKITRIRSVPFGARRSVREALRQNSGETAVSGKLRTWEGWSSKNAWVSRANARDAWLAQVSDKQIASNIKACLLALTETTLRLLQTGDSRDFLRAARALTLQYPPVARVADVTDVERIGDLPDLSDDDLGRMRAIRDEARQKNGVTPPS